MMKLPKFASGAAKTLFVASTAYCQVVDVLAMPTEQFDQFLPGWDHDIQGVLRDNCSDVLADYKTGRRTPGSAWSSLVTPVISCVLENLNESKKAEITPSSVLLGLLPTILQSVGSSPMEIAMIGLRRPLLAFLLSVGNPSVGGMKTFEVLDGIESFVQQGDQRPFAFSWGAGSTPATGSQRLLGLVIGIWQYVFVCGAVLNLVQLAYQLGIHAVAMFAPETVFGVPLWTSLGALCHLVAILILHLCVTTSAAQQKNDSDSGKGPARVSTGTKREKIGGWSVKNEFTHSGYLPNRKITMRRSQFIMLDHFLAWLLGFGALSTMIFGTLVFSSLLFFNVKDALEIVLRYIGSALVVRMVTRMEMNGMNGSFIRKGDEDSKAMPLRPQARYLGMTESTDRLISERE